MSSPGSPGLVQRCEVIWFELYADDVDRANRFYQRVFAWTTRPFLDHDPTGGYLLVSYGHDERPQGEVPDLSVTVDALAEAGGELVEDRRMVGTDPGGGFFCIVRDSEGNLIGLWASRSA